MAFELGPRRGIYIDITEDMKKSGPPLTDEDVHHFEEFDLIYRSLCALLYNYVPMSGHPGGSLSCTDILTALYFRVLRHDPNNPAWPDRDRFIMSKGHASPAMYAVLAEAGYFPTDELLTFRKLGSRLQGHNVMGVPPGVEMSAGALGMGLSFSLGQALAGRMDSRSYHLYCLLSDGDCNEGQTWEAAATTTHHQADNVIAIVDYTSSLVNRILRS